MSSPSVCDLLELLWEGLRYRRKVVLKESAEPRGGGRSGEDEAMAFMRWAGEGTDTCSFS